VERWRPRTLARVFVLTNPSGNLSFPAWPASSSGIERWRPWSELIDVLGVSFIDGKLVDAPVEDPGIALGSPW
jgi:hypothetical protein